MKDKLRNVLGFIYSKTFYLFILLLAFYFSLDGMLLNVGTDIPFPKIVLALVLVLVVFFLLYVCRYLLDVPVKNTKDVPLEIIKRPKRYVVMGFIGMTVLTSAFIIVYYFGVSTNSGVKTIYYASQPCYQVLFAPIVEELLFRYILYDGWARNKLGRFKGAFVVGIIFILFHFPVSIGLFVLYIVPVVFLFLFYEQFGLYGAILAHMTYNFLAL